MEATSSVDGWRTRKKGWEARASVCACARDDGWLKEKEGMGLIIY